LWLNCATVIESVVASRDYRDCAELDIASHVLRHTAATGFDPKLMDIASLDTTRVDVLPRTDDLASPGAGST
jgi:hypothetical protein